MSQFYIYIIVGSVLMHVVFGLFVYYIVRKFNNAEMAKYLGRNGAAFKRTRQRKVYKYVEQGKGGQKVRGYWIKCDIGPILISNN